jgi:hypothetical protein
MRKTTPSASRPRPVRRRNPIAATTPAAGSTAVSGAHACSASGAWPPRPPAASSDTTPIPHRDQHPIHEPGRARWSGPPVHRSSPQPDPPTADSAPAPAAHHPPRPAPRPAARPSCDHTPPASPRHAASPSSRTPQGSPSLPPVSSHPPSSDRALTTTRARLPAPQDRNVGRNRGHPWGETVATSAAIQWPPTGSFSWPPSETASQKGDATSRSLTARGIARRTARRSTQHPPSRASGSVRLDDPVARG